MNAIIGILYHAIGGFASGSFYIPYKRVKEWNWEVYWIIGGLFAWIIVPWIVAYLTIPNISLLAGEVFRNKEIHTNVVWTFVFGLLWGVGGLTFGLSMRYLGMSLGYALSLGITASIGTLIPPIFHGDLGMLFSTNYGIATLTGIVVCLFGIGIVGKAGKMKDDNLPKEKKQSAIEEFNFKKGVIVAIIAGIMSACFAFGLDAGRPIADLAIKNGTHSLFQSSAVYLLVLAGGFTTNFIWCLSIMLRKRSYKQLFQINALWIPNLSFSALAGIIWYFQFLFYGMGSSKLGRTMDFASWTIHMAFIIIFSNIWALVLKEWIGVKSGIIRILFIGLGILVFSTVIIGFGSYLKGLD